MAFATHSSPSLYHARRRALLLYREILQTIPVALERFNIPHDEKDVRRRVRLEFEKYRGVNDVDAVDYLNFRGRLELEEVKKMWKQKPHLLCWLDSPTQSLIEADSNDAESIHAFVTGQKSAEEAFK